MVGTMPRPYCVVLMPFGPKKDASGATVDCDAVYRDVIHPAIDAAELEPIRADEATSPSVEDAEVGIVVDLFLSYRAVKAWQEMVALVGRMARPVALASDEDAAMAALRKAIPLIREAWEPETTARNIRLIREARDSRGTAESWLATVEQERAKRLSWDRGGRAGRPRRDDLR